MKLLITGATGFVGRNLAEHFHGQGMQVLATGRNREIGAELEKEGIAFKPADIADRQQVQSVFEPADVAIHCAGKSGDWGRYGEFFQANVEGTRNVVAACRENGIGKLIFTSTPAVYFNGKDRLNITEEEPLPGRMATPYAKTKLINEKELSALADEGFQVIQFRPRALFGPYDRTILPRILQMAQKPPMPLINGGKALVDITCIENFADAVQACLTAPDTAWNQTYNLSNGSPIQVKDWFAQILELFGLPFIPKNIPEPVAKTLALAMEGAAMLPFANKKPLMTRFSVGYLAKSMTLSIEKAQKNLGYEPRVTSRQGLERYAQWRQGTAG